MALTRVNPDWAFGGKLSSDELDAIEDNIISALDKRAGQTDTLASDVEVTGETTFTGDTTVDGALDVNGVTTVDGDLTVNGPMVVTSSLDVSGPAAFPAGDTLTSDRDIQLQNANNLQLASGNVTLSPARTVTRILPLRALLVGETTSAVLGSAGGPSDSLQSPTTAVTTQSYTSLTFASVDTGSAFVKMWMLNLTPYVPNGATITEVAIELRGAGGHAALPTVMPAIKVGRSSSGASDVLHSAANPIVDASASTGTYQSAHGITATCDQNNVVDKSTYHYWLAIFNEGSTNGIAGLIVQRLTITFTVPSVSVAP